MMGPDHIVRKPDDWNCRGRLLCGANSKISASHNDIGSRFNQFRRKFRNQPNALSIPAPIDCEVLTFYEAGPPKFFEQRNDLRYFTWAGGQAAEAIHPARLLRA